MVSSTACLCSTEATKRLKLTYCPPSLGSDEESADYVALSETVMFNTNETEKTVTIRIRADRNIEDSEDFTVIISPLNNPDNPFPVRVNPEEDITIVTIMDEEGE